MVRLAGTDRRTLSDTSVQLPSPLIPPYEIISSDSAKRSACHRPRPTTPSRPYQTVKSSTFRPRRVSEGNNMVACRIS